MMKVGIFLIAYNAEAHIAQTLERIPAEVWNEIDQAYIVDDCSTDETVDKAVALCKDYPKLKVIRNRINRRYGGNQKTGYQYAIDQGLDVVVMLHADGQYAPEVLRSMYRPIVEDRADVVLGSRMIHRQDALKGGMPRYKYMGNIVLTWMQNKLTGLQLAEFHTGYRAYRVSLLKNLPFWENSNEWHFDTEILLQATRAAGRITEIPIPTYYGSEICHVNGLAYAWNCVRTSMGFACFTRGIFYSRKYDVSLTRRNYFSKFDDPYSSHSIILKSLLQHGLTGKQVLELGVGDASLTEKMSAAGAHVTCMRVDPDDARPAESFAKDVAVRDIERRGYSRAGEKDQYDIIVAADILEHVLDPEALLSKLKIALKRGGVLVVSLPNVANLYVRLNLLLGRFPYHTKGLLDASHLHFYTLASMRKLLAKTGWEVQKHFVTSIPISIVFPFLNRRPFRWALSVSHACTCLFRGLFAYQGVFVCKNPNGDALL